jgi:NADH-quinone oxidoreductase subunit C
MTPEEMAARLLALLGNPEDAQVSVSGGGPGHERVTIDLPPNFWPAGFRGCRTDPELACDFFDWLSAVDEGEAGFSVVAHLWSTTARHGLLLRTRISAQVPMIQSVAEIYPGASWHERETHEMFGISFPGHPDLDPLLLPPEFEGHPLRKDFVLASRVAKAWPGAKEPGEPPGGSSRRQPMRPPGVPAPGEWGPGPAASSEGE